MKLNNFAKRAFAVGLALSMVVSGSGVNTDIATAAKKPKLSKSKLTINAGKTATLKVKNAKKKVKWSTNKKKIVKITVSGKKKETAVIKGLKKGKAVVTAKVGKKKIKCKIAVKAQKPNFKSVSVDTYDDSCLVLNLKKKDSSLKAEDLTVNTKSETNGAFNNAVNVQKIVAVNAKKYRVYLMDSINNGGYVQITSGVSKASTQYKLPFQAKSKTGSVDVLLEKGDNCVESLSRLFENQIGDVKIAITKGTLPAGLELDKKFYMIKGIPTEAKTSQVTIKATDELGRSATLKVNFGIYDNTTLAVGNSNGEIAWTHTMQENAAAQAAANTTKLDIDKLDDPSDCYAQTYRITPMGGSGTYTYTLDTPDNADVRLTTDKIADDASKTVTKKAADETTLCIPYSITAGTHTYKVVIADVMDANRTCTATITVKVVPYYTISGVVKSNNGLPISGVCVDFISPKEGEEVDSAYTSRRYNGASLQHGNGYAAVAYYEAELPADTYIVKVEGDVTYEATSKLKVAKADKIANVTVPERFYTVSGTAAYSNGNKLKNDVIEFEWKNHQYETYSGDFGVDTNETGNFSVALPEGTYTAYVKDEKGNRKYFSKNINVTNKDVSVGTIKATLARYSVEGLVFNGTSIDAQTQFADKIADTQLYFYNDKGLCVAQPKTDSEGYYKVFVPGDATYTVKMRYANAVRTLGTVAVAKANQKDINLTYAVATDIAGATAYTANPLAPEAVLNSVGGSDVIWSFTPAETGIYNLAASTAVNNGAELALFDANMQYIAGSTTAKDDDSPAVLTTKISKVVLEANKVYYIKVQPTGVKGSNPYTPQAQGEVKLAITKEAVATPTPAPTTTPEPTTTPDPDKTPAPASTATAEPTGTPDVIG